MDKERWEKECQTFELNFHQGYNYRWEASFIDAWRKHFMEWCELAGTWFIDEWLFDVGCGSRPALAEVFPRNIVINIDPLLDKYRKIPEVAKYWANIMEHRNYSVDAEMYIEHLWGMAAFISCWNVLDHCYDWRAVVHNLAQYAKSGAKVALGTDVHPHRGHPGIDNVDELFAMLNQDFNVLKQEPGYWGRDIALLLEKR